MNWRVFLCLLLTGCGGGTSSSGAHGENRIPLTSADLAAIEMVGGLNGTWYPAREVIRVDADPPSQVPHARAVTWQSLCGQASHLYRNSISQSPEWIALRLVHEGQHHVDGCKVGEYWEQRAADAVQCWRQGIPRSQCQIS